MRQPSARFRSLPDVLIIGAQRSGTSSLYKYLGAHPDISPSLRKETEYFSRYHDRGEMWYRAHFPMGVRGRIRRVTRRPPLVSFEATPDYLLDPRAARRAAELVPQAKLIALLREPGARAISQHKHMVRLGYETLELEAALEAEETRIGTARERIASDESYVSAAFLRYSYFERGRYADHLRRWFDEFAPDRILIVRSEDLFADPKPTFASILEFIDVAPWEPPEFANHSYTTSPPRAPSTEVSLLSQLEGRYAPLNRQLYTMLGRDLGWATATESPK